MRERTGLSIGFACRLRGLRSACIRLRSNISITISLRRVHGHRFIGFSLFLGGIDFSGLYVLLGSGEYPSIAAAEAAGAAVFAYGRFIMAVINFLIIAWVVFLLVKAVNRVRDATTAPKVEAPASEPGPSELDILIEIRDALRK